MNAELERFIAVTRERVDAALDRLLPSTDDDPERLHEAMRYAVTAGGKRVRPVLVHATGTALGAAPEQLDTPACSVELIHAYSLVHDDLPAMDDDDLRRGRPTCHRAYDEATAILVGDGLQTLAFEALACDPQLDVTAERRLVMVAELARASGSRGMVGGQAIDVAAAGNLLDERRLEGMHRLKTGALIRCAVRLGAIAGNADPTASRNLDRYAEALGLAFQVRDDILDVEADTETLGKPQGADAARGKPTYTSLLGLDGARAKLASLHREALEALAGFDTGADPLRWLADYVVNRSH